MEASPETGAAHIPVPPPSVGEPGPDRAPSHLHGIGATAPIEIDTTFADTPLGHLRELFGLSPFELRVLMLCAGMELDGSFAALCGMAQSDPTKTYPTFGLALAALHGPDWRALMPESPLRYWQLVTSRGDQALTSAPLTIDERILHFLIGFPCRDPRLAPWAHPLETPPALVASERRAAERIAGIFRGSGPSAADRGPRRPEQRGRQVPVVQLVGPEIAGKRELAADAGRRLGVEVRRMSAESLPTQPTELDEIARLWRREARLSGAFLLLECDELRADDVVRAASLHQLVDRLDVPLLISALDRLPPRQRTTVTLDLGKPPTEEQIEAWRSEIGDLWHGLPLGMASGVNAPAAPDPDPEALPYLRALDEMVQQFDLSPRQIRSACVDARGALGEAPSADELRAEIWRSSRVLARPRLEDLAPVSDPSSKRQDLVLPRSSRRLLDEILIHMRQRSRVHREWGFGGRASGRGLGITALFAGPSGTGKTLAAEVLAAELELDLARIDLSAVVSKYIGETEKNLRRVFDAAEDGGAVLLFDEADALFGKRSEVRDSHDRHANVEVSYLLQRMEAYRGLAILTTNLKDALDPAFLRRLRFVVDFPFPSAAQREEIWRRSFPGDVPLADLYYDRLARLRLAGGNIRNIALGAAFLAADDASPVTMRHLLLAARREHLKIGRHLSDTEVADWLSSSRGPRGRQGPRGDEP